jgi:hypothetical protein
MTYCRGLAPYAYHGRRPQRRYGGALPLPPPNNRARVGGMVCTPQPAVARHGGRASHRYRILGALRPACTERVPWTGHTRRCYAHAGGRAVCASIALTPAAGAATARSGRSKTLPLTRVLGVDSTRERAQNFGTYLSFCTAALFWCCMTMLHELRI